jgi:hypothetical protein
MEILPIWNTVDTINMLRPIRYWIFTSLFLVAAIAIIILLVCLIVRKIRKQKLFDGIVKEICVWLTGPIIILLTLIIVSFIYRGFSTMTIIIQLFAFIIGGVVMIIFGKKLNILTVKNKLFIIGIIFYWLIFVFYSIPTILDKSYSDKPYIEPTITIPGELPDVTSY